MDRFCHDRDLLAFEPDLFAGGQPAQEIASGADGALAGTTFTAAGADLIAAGAAAGMVVRIAGGAPESPTLCEIISVDSPTQLTVSRLRASVDDDPIPLPAAADAAWCVRTFAAQIRDASATLAEKLRRVTEASGIAAAGFADSDQLRVATACGALAGIFVARAADAADRDANWTKAEHYRREFRRRRLELRLAVDADGDGVAERTRTLGNVTLRRI